MNHTPKLLLISPYFFEEKRWMISAYKTALALSKRMPVVVLTTGRPWREEVHPNLTIYRMRDWFLPDPLNLSIVPGLLPSLLTVLHRERPTHILVNKHMFFTSFSVPILRLLGRSVITATDTFPGITWFPRSRRLHWLHRACAALFGMPFLQLSSRVILFHEGLVPVAKRYRLRYQVIPNGVDLEMFDEATANSELRDSRYTTVLYVGRLESVKGYDDILAVAKEMTAGNAKLRFIFVGSTKGKEAIVAAETSEQILFLGHRTDIASIMKACDIFVLASYAEGLPNALMEAMACRLACVSSAVGGVLSLIRDGENGLLFPAADRKALREKISKLAENAPERLRLGRAARMTIEERYSWAAIADQYEALFAASKPQSPSRGRKHQAEKAD